MESVEVKEKLCLCGKLTHEVCMRWFKFGEPACSFCVHFKKLPELKKDE